jgi:ABC-type multidrug transport system ATPase subunit
MESAISTAGLTKHYKGVEALTDLTLDVPAGTVYGFLGPNGAGETTAMKVIAGLTTATRGISNSEATLDLETVFLRLIDQMEVAA